MENMKQVIAGLVVLAGLSTAVAVGVIGAVLPDGHVRVAAEGPEAAALRGFAVQLRHALQDAEGRSTISSQDDDGWLRGTVPNGYRPRWLPAGH